MKAYAITGVGFYGTQAELHDAARSLPTSIPDPEIVEIELPTDKSAILKILNGELLDYELIRQFEMTPRGGMVPIDESKSKAIAYRRDMRDEPKLTTGTGFTTREDPFDMWQKVFGGTLIRPEDRSEDRRSAAALAEAEEASAVLEQSKMGVAP